MPSASTVSFTTVGVVEAALTLTGPLAFAPTRRNTAISTARIAIFDLTSAPVAIGAARTGISSTMELPCTAASLLLTIHSAIARFAAGGKAKSTQILEHFCTRSPPRTNRVKLTRLGQQLLLAVLMLCPGLLLPASVNASA